MTRISTGIMTTRLTFRRSPSRSGFPFLTGTGAREDAESRLTDSREYRSNRSFADCFLPLAIIHLLFSADGVRDNVLSRVTQLLFAASSRARQGQHVVLVWPNP